MPFPSISLTTAMIVLARPCFAMAELEVRDLPEYPITMDWCRSWNLELLFVHDLGDPSPLRPVAHG